MNVPREVGQDGQGGGGAPHRRTDRERQVGARAEARAGFGAAVVNADSMQVYKDLRILTARPTPDEERVAPHRLFGEIDGAVNFSAGQWARRAAEILGRDSANGR